MNGLLGLILLKLEKFNLESAENAERKKLWSDRFIKEGKSFKRVLSREEFLKGIIGTALIKQCHYRVFELYKKEEFYHLQLVGRDFTGIDIKVSPYDIPDVLLAMNNSHVDMRSAFNQIFNEETI